MREPHLVCDALTFSSEPHTGCPSLSGPIGSDFVFRFFGFTLALLATLG